MKNIGKLFYIGFLFPFLVNCGSNSNVSESNQSICSHDYQMTISKKPNLEETGTATFKCKICEDSYEEIVPKLNENDYQMNEINPTCLKEGKITYTNKYGTFEIPGKAKLDHTTEDGRCDMCKKLINNLEFLEENIVNTRISGGYPRAIKLSNENWLIGCDGGSIKTYLSSTEGYSIDSSAVANTQKDGTCGNIDFFEMDNGDILCSYRCIGPGQHRALYTSISHDGGLSWEEFNTIVDNFDMGYSTQEVNAIMNRADKIGVLIGFYEPFIEKMGDKITVVYADDFSPMAEKVYEDDRQCYGCQYLMAADLEDGRWVNHRVIMDGSKLKSPTGSDIEPRISRDGMPVFTTLSDGTIVLVFEGTYRNDDAHDNLQFEILMSYSKDNGATFSNPVEIYVPTGHLTKASAPYIVCSEDDRLIVSFQTNEDCFGTDVEYIGASSLQDSRSSMRCMISDGTSVENITKDSFFPARNVFCTKPGATSIWNGMMYDEGKIYCFGGVYTTVKYNVSELPILDKKVN